MKYPNKIKEVRELRGLNQAELARRMGVMPSTISRLETGARKITQDYLNEIARILNCAPGDLIENAAKGIDATNTVGIVGSAELDSWRKEGAARQKLESRAPVFLPEKYAKLAGGAYVVEDNHAAALGIPAGATAITVPYDGIRAQPIEGDIYVVERREGALVNHVIGKTKIDSRGAVFVIDGEEVVHEKGVHPRALVVSVYWEV